MYLWHSYRFVWKWGDGRHTWGNSKGGSFYFSVFFSFTFQRYSQTQSSLLLSSLSLSRSSPFSSYRHSLKHRTLVRKIQPKCRSLPLTFPGSTFHSQTGARPRPCLHSIKSKCVMIFNCLLHILPTIQLIILFRPPLLSLNRSGINACLF